MSHCVALSPTRAEIDFILRSNAEKRRITETQEPQANESRHRDPSPHSVERYRCEGVIDPKDAKPLLEQAPRGRSRSARPSLVRAPTPYYPREEQQRDGKKGVHWTDPLEQPATDNRHPAAHMRSVLKKTEANRRENDSVAEEEEEKDHSKHEEEQPRVVRQYKPSGIPRPKTVPKSESSSELSRLRRRPTPYPITSTTKEPQRPQNDRPPSPLIPQEVPAPLRISPTKNSLRRGQTRTITSSVSAPEVTDKSQPTSSRDFSFGKSEVIALAHRPIHQQHAASVTVEKSTTQPTSLLKNKPRRRGTFHPSSPKARPKPAITEQSSKVEVKTSITASLPKSSSTASFQTAKNLWGKISNNDNNTGSAAAFGLPNSKSTPSVGISPKKSRIPVSSSTTSFHTAKSFWSEITTTSCEAVVSGPGSSSKADFASPVRDSCRKSKVAELARYTVNSLLKKSGGGGGAVGSGSVSGGLKCESAVKISQASSRIPKSANIESARASTSSASAKPRPMSMSKLSPSECTTASNSSLSLSTTTGSSESSYETAKSHLSATGVSNSTTSLEAQYNPSVQSELWNDIMRFCSSETESASCPRFCDCDDCIWGEMRDDVGCSTVARVGGGRCSARGR